MAPRPSPTTQSAGAETRAKILAATLRTLRDEGIVGTSARAIARAGDFNQALIFYHFGSVTELLVAAAVAESSQRAERYEPVLATVTTLPELVKVARQLHELEEQNGGLNILTQLMAGAASTPELQRGLLDAFAPWMALVQDAVARVLSGTPYEQVVPIGDVSFAITSLFVGIELLHNLDPARESAPSLFGTFEALAGVLETLIRPT